MHGSTMRTCACTCAWGWHSFRLDPPNACEIVIIVFQRSSCLVSANNISSESLLF